MSKIAKRIIRIAFCILAAAWPSAQMAAGQLYTPTFAPITVSGGTISVPNLFGAYNVSFEELFTGSPATVSVTIQGCSRGGTCDSAADTYTKVADAIRFVSFSKAYGSFLVTASWTGGTNPTVTINPALSTARNSSGARFGFTTGAMTAQTSVTPTNITGMAWSNGLVRLGASPSGC